MKKKKATKKREYTLGDLVAMAEQMGGRIRFQIVPVEELGLPRVDAPDTHTGVATE